MSGQSLANYEILDLLGAGGMGDVYRARDTTLGREVAIKVLPEEFTTDAERLARFEREARVLASLDHPNIAQIHGLEEHDGRRFLVLELVEGESLAERVARGPIPVDDALPIALQIASALETAHGRGIIHRDVKPANVMVTKDGVAKVLDFGIAKPFAVDRATQTRTRALAGPPTRPGVAMGTPAYMSPEQLRCDGADRRSDIWAFGVTLWEMLTGARLFECNTDSDTVAAVLRAEPEWDNLPLETPPSVRRLLRRCLERDPRHRLHDIADARLEIEEGLTGADGTVIGHVQHPTPILRHDVRGVWPGLLVAFVLGVVAAASGWSILRDRPTPYRAPIRLSMSLPPDAVIRAVQLPVLAVSPDGGSLVFEAGGDRNSQLYRRSIERFETVPIPGTEDASTPFISPDGGWVGFFANGQLKKVSLSGGSPHVLCDAPNPFGGSWGTDGTIIFTPTDAGELWRVAAVGGEPEVLLVPDPREGVWGYAWPEFLPDGKAVLYTSWWGFTAASSTIGVLDLESRENKVLLENASYARYLPTGHLVYGRGNRVEVVPFDLRHRQVTGPSVPVPDPIFYEPENGVPHLAFSTGGSLAFIPGGGRPQRRLVSVDLAGTEEPLAPIGRGFAYPRFSPDGGRLAVTISESGSASIWVINLKTGTQTKLPVEGNHAFPVWTPDGDRIAFSGETAEPPASWSLFWQRPEGTGPAELLLGARQAGEQLWPVSWSPDGKALVLGADAKYSPESREDIWVMSLEDDRKVRRLVATEATDVNGVVSPDGRWIAYTSRDSGQLEVYVQGFPDGGKRHQVSTDGGGQPIWSPDGRGIYWISGRRVMVTPVVTVPDFRCGAPRTLFEGSFAHPLFINFSNFDVAPDGQHFVMVKPDEDWGRATEIRVVLNWFEELERLAPTDRTQ